MDIHCRVEKLKQICLVKLEDEGAASVIFDCIRILVCPEQSGLGDPVFQIFCYFVEMAYLGVDALVNAALV